MIASLEEIIDQGLIVDTFTLGLALRFFKTSWIFDDPGVIWDQHGGEQGESNIEGVNTLHAARNPIEIKRKIHLSRSCINPPRIVYFEE